MLVIKLSKGFALELHWLNGDSGGMSTAAFQQTISDGMIRLPADAQSKFAGTVNVIVWQEDTPALGTEQDIFDELFENPLPAFTPLTRDEIYEGR